MDGMKTGDKIRVTTYIMGHEDGYKDFVIEEYYHCLGFFATESDRKAQKFTPLCDLLIPGPDSKQDYISNYGEYMTNLVQGWADLPRD